MTSDVEIAVATEDVQGKPDTPGIDIQCLTIAECTQVADQIRQHLLTSPKLRINLSVCEEIDTAGVQLLAILRCDESVSGRIIFDTPSEVAESAFSVLGLASLLSISKRPL